ncbi:hypothetical protein TNCV_3567291 [Trichonephila clavipes]|nr:hypothetical protein TNCV_3567291 [Trichonephila clavipes]
MSFTPNAAVLFVDVAIQPEVRIIAKQNSLMKIATIIFEIKLHNLKALFRRESIHDELPYSRPPNSVIVYYSILHSFPGVVVAGLFCFWHSDLMTFLAPWSRGCTVALFPIS